MGRQTVTDSLSHAEHVIHRLRKIADDAGMFDDEKLEAIIALIDEEFPHDPLSAAPQVRSHGRGL